MKKFIALLLAASMTLSLAACAKTDNTSASEDKTPASVSSVASVDNGSDKQDSEPAATVSSFLWDNFDDRDPNNKPELGPNGVNIWWDNWANLRAKNEDGAMKLDYRPKEYDPEDFETKEEYYAAAGDWMGNWGEAVNMWALEGISYCKYLTIRIKGETGGEEKSLLMDWHPEDAKFYSARFADLVLADGTNPVITTEWQDFVIDLEASGFPGMTNALHIRAFAPCVIWLDEIIFTEPVAPIDATSTETIVGGFNVPESGKPADLDIRGFQNAVMGASEFLWDNFDDRDPNNKPELGPNGVNIWWDNWANLRAKNEDGAMRLDYRPKAFDPEDYETEDAYFAAAGDWMGNWGEAVNMWALDGISFCKYLKIKIKGEAGGEEKSLIMDWHPEDSKFYAARFADLVLADGTHPAITTDWQELVIDLEASGFPGMTNALHIRAFAPCVITIDDIVFTEPVAAVDTTDGSTIVGGMTVPETGKPADLNIRGFLGELE